MPKNNEKIETQITAMESSVRSIDTGTMEKKKDTVWIMNPGNVNPNNSLLSAGDFEIGFAKAFFKMNKCNKNIRNKVIVIGNNTSDFQPAIEV
ncbi:unnamed protein product [Ambrosiozyma monospora]|uniref:Unnamed protein product n=1 Tax=Ambrosiozyma monospora TaxID=43982 RepID=A0A9W7DN16_AMBMO|nr:unnamed protein product [Ambrosiozyma monospora]